MDKENTKIAAFGIMAIVAIFFGFVLSNNFNPEGNVVPASNRQKPQTNYVVVTNIIYVHLTNDKVSHIEQKVYRELPPMVQLDTTVPCDPTIRHFIFQTNPPIFITNGFINR